MNRIDSVNARPDANGTGKTGFHDNADLAGQDATYLTPKFLNTVQEELCALIEGNGGVLNPSRTDQLLELLATQEDLIALAAALQVLLDGKYNKSGGVISGNVEVQGNIKTTWNVESAHVKTTTLELGAQNKSSQSGYTSLPNGWIMQCGFINYEEFLNILEGSTTDERFFDLSFPHAFPTKCLSIGATVCINNLDIENDTWAQVKGVTQTGAKILNQTTNPESGDRQPFERIFWQAFGY